MPTRNKSKKPAKGPAKVPPRPLGLLPVPPTVERMVQESLSEYDTPESIQFRRNGWTLEYYYGGDIVLVREDHRGVDVRAAGKEVFPALRALTPSERMEFEIAYPRGWNEL